MISSQYLPEYLKRLLHKNISLKESELVINFAKKCSKLLSSTRNDQMQIICGRIWTERRVLLYWWCHSKKWMWRQTKFVIVIICLPWCENDSPYDLATRWEKWDLRLLVILWNNPKRRSRITHSEWALWIMRRRISEHTDTSKAWLGKLRPADGVRPTDYLIRQGGISKRNFRKLMKLL